MAFSVRQVSEFSWHPGNVITEEIKFSWMRIDHHLDDYIRVSASRAAFQKVSGKKMH